MENFLFNVVKITKNEKITQGYVFFYSGVFSQWHFSLFVDEDNIQYNSCEQYMMYQKAKLFNDEKAMEAILRAAHPGTIKKIGRQVKNFDPTIWDKYKEGIVYKGNFFKFSQNISMKEKLFNTRNKVLVEASPSDYIWGIGKGMNDSTLSNTDEWGQNLLGKALVLVREDLKNLTKK